MKDKHTQEPWFANEEQGGFIEIVDKKDRLILQILSDGPEAKESEGWVPAAEAEANKQLVLASPRLYRHLKCLADKVEHIKIVLQKKDPEFVKAWLNDGVLEDSRKVLNEVAAPECPRTGSERRI